MYDMYTEDQLHQLHTSLYCVHQALMGKIVDPETSENLVPVLSDRWNVISAACREISEAMTEVRAEIARRDQEPADV